MKCLSLLLTSLGVFGLTLSSVQLALGEHFNWRNERKDFERKTQFELCPNNQLLLGGRFVDTISGNLPYWFDFQLYKKVYNISYPNSSEDHRRHINYIDSCFQTLFKRVLRKILAATQYTYIDSNADKFENEIFTSINQDEIGGYSIPITEDPIQRGIRLMKNELEQTESLNQLHRYLEEFSVSN